MPTEEDSIAQLLQSGLTREEIDSGVIETIARMKGLINAKTALYVMMKKQGLILEEEKQLSSSGKDFKINELKEDSTNINLAGRIVDFSTINSFNRKDGSGKG